MNNRLSQLYAFELFLVFLAIFLGPFNWRTVVHDLPFDKVIDFFPQNIGRHHCTNRAVLWTLSYPLSPYQILVMNRTLTWILIMWYIFFSAHGYCLTLSNQQRDLILIDVSTQPWLSILHYTKLIHIVYPKHSHSWKL